MGRDLDCIANLLGGRIHKDCIYLHKDCIGFYRRLDADYRDGRDLHCWAMRLPNMEWLNVDHMCVCKHGSYVLLENTRGLGGFKGQDLAAFRGTRSSQPSPGA